MTSSRVDGAVRRALDQREREAADDVERILTAAVAVMERAAPAEPRINDIISEAGVSNKAFYRYFRGKDDLILAVMERGVGILASYLEHRMAKEDDPARRIVCWAEGVLVQAAVPDLARATRAATAQMALVVNGPTDGEMTGPLRDLLVEPAARLGSADARRDADAIFEAVFGTMRRHLAAGTYPDADDVAHLLGFCLKALGVPGRPRDTREA